jgi:flagellar hook protein FlgE
VAGALERSNVDLPQEFTRMLVTQKAYNASATAFRTTDEMTTIARDLKR